MLMHFTFDMIRGAKKTLKIFYISVLDFLRCKIQTEIVNKTYYFVIFLKY